MPNEEARSSYGGWLFWLTTLLVSGILFSIGSLIVNHVMLELEQILQNQQEIMRSQIALEYTCVGQVAQPRKSPLPFR